MKSVFINVLTVMAVISLSCAVGGQEKLPLPELEEGLKNELNEYLDTHYMTPEEYVISKFKDHDVVILGEQHRARHDVILVQNLIPQLYEAGIYFLGTEFARRIDQPLIDSLLDAPEYDDNLAQQIAFNQSVFWGYREYVDIFRSAWELNNSLPGDASKFRILALNNDPDWHYIKTKEDRDKGPVMKKVWHGETEKDWADVILTQVIEKGEKALAYCGIHHAISEYRQPIFIPRDSSVRFEEDRFGRHLYNALGKRVMTIFLHNYWNTRDFKNYVYPINGYIDALMLERDSTAWRVGFDVKGTPFEQLKDEASYYAMGYENFNLGMFCDGYIYQMPLSRYEAVNCIEGFINEDNIEQARINSPNPDYRNSSVEEFEKGMKSDIRSTLYRYKRLH